MEGSRNHLIAVDVLRDNYNVLNHMYRLGRFEYPVAERITDAEGHPLQVLIPTNEPGTINIWHDIGLLESRDNIQPWTLAPPPADLPPGWRWSRINDVARGLYDLARTLLLQSPHLFLNSFCLPIRALALAYEIRDYLLIVSKEESQFFVNWAEQIAPDIDAHVKDNYPVGDQAERLRLTKNLIIISLCGINELYRRHHAHAYEQALGLLKSIESYLHGPLLDSQKQKSLGLTGLTNYLIGRVTFALGRPNASKAFLVSTEAYANRVYQKEAARDRGEISAQEYEEARLVSLRRSALAAALGTGYIAMSRSRVTEALQSVTLARGVLKQNCGQVYAAYTEFIYAQAKRALGSSDLKELRQVKNLFRRCARDFEQLVPNSHYPCRVQVERAILCHYSAQCHELIYQEQSKLKQDKFSKEHVRQRLFKFYDKGIDLLTKAIEYAQADTGVLGREMRNPRMLAEALYLRSHLRRYQSKLCDDPSDKMTLALEDARKALKHAEGMRQLECEAYITLGAAYSALATSALTTKLPGSEEEGDALKNSSPLLLNVNRSRAASVEQTGEIQMRSFQELREDAKDKFINALKLNEGNNPRVSADCYLHLSQLALLTPTTYPDARTYYKKYQEEVGPFVDHAYCHNVARDIERRLDESGQFFFVDVRESLNVDYWNAKVREYLINETLNQLASSPRRQDVLAAKRASARKRGASKSTRLANKNSQEGRTTVKSILADELVNSLGVSRATAYNWIDDGGLENSLIDKCETL